MTQDKADLLLDTLIRTISWRNETATIVGKRIPLPRLTAWHGDKPYRYSGITHDPAPWTPALLELKTIAETTAQTGFNSVLLNLYRNGRDSMSWHADDERELGPDPVIASISLGGTRKFQMRHKRDKNKKVEILLTHGSCLVMAGGMQSHWLHQIPKTARPAQPRINLTFRRIVD